MASHQTVGLWGSKPVILQYCAGRSILVNGLSCVLEVADELEPGGARE